MKAVDTSVVVAAFATWHEGHEAAVQALAQSPRIPAHVLIETFSVLTRLPPPHRAPPAVVWQFLSARFPDAALTLSGEAHHALIASAAQDRTAGGAIYDALIGATALAHGATLLTRDHRAKATYDRLGVRCAFVG